MSGLILNRDTNYYQVLGLSFPAKSSLIKRAYRKLSLQFHPDKGGNEDLFNAVREAYEVLSNENTKRLYNRLGKTVFACKTCVSFVDYWLSQRMMDTVFNYFFGVIFLMWAS